MPITDEQMERLGKECLTAFYELETHICDMQDGKTNLNFCEIKCLVATVERAVSACCPGTPDEKRIKEIKAQTDGSTARAIDLEFVRETARRLWDHSMKKKGPSSPKKNRQVLSKAPADSTV